MGEQELKHVIALLLEDAKRIQQLEPNAGTEARIWLAKEALESGDEAKEDPVSPVQRMADAITEIRALQLHNPVIERPLKKLICAADQLLGNQ